MNWTFPGYQPGQALDWEDLANRYDWIRDMQGVPQDPHWHGEGDVYVHTQWVVRALLALPAFAELADQDKHILVAAALLHDVEKRSTTVEEVIEGETRIVSPGHAKKGEHTARSILYRDLPTPFAIREAIAKLVRLHGLPLWAIDKADPQKAVIAASLVVNTEHLALLAQADVLGRICPDQADLLLKIDLFRTLCEENRCLGQPRAFATPYARYWYLNKAGATPDYEPYDDLKFDVIVLSALPGSGKDTYLQRELADWPVLSLDDIRRAQGIDPQDKKGNGQVIQMGKEQARIYMRARTSFVFNATNLTRDMRSRWIDLFTGYGGRVKIVYLEVPYSQLMRQNAQRAYPVPAAVIDRLINKLDLPDAQEAHMVDFRVEP